MKTSTLADFSRSEASALSFNELKPEDMNSSLLSFYLGLDFDARRERFGCGVSDGTIRQHCAQLDPSRTVVQVCFGPAVLFAAIELHALSSDWEDLELAITAHATTDQRTIIAQLLQLVAFAAGKRGCSTFIVTSCLPEFGLLELLRGMGRVRVQDGVIRIELGEYARRAAPALAL